MPTSVSTAVLGSSRSASTAQIPATTATATSTRPGRRPAARTTRSRSAVTLPRIGALLGLDVRVARDSPPVVNLPCCSHGGAGPRRRGGYTNWLMRSISACVMPETSGGTAVGHRDRRRDGHAGDGRQRRSAPSPAVSTRSSGRRGRSGGSRRPAGLREPPVAAGQLVGVRAVGAEASRIGGEVLEVQRVRRAQVVQARAGVEGLGRRRGVGEERVELALVVAEEREDRDQLAQRAGRPARAAARRSRRIRSAAGNPVFDAVIQLVEVAEQRVQVGSERRQVDAASGSARAPPAAAG